MLKFNNQVLIAFLLLVFVPQSVRGQIHLDSISTKTSFLHHPEVKAEFLPIGTDFLTAQRNSFRSSFDSVHIKLKEKHDLWLRFSLVSGRDTTIYFHYLEAKYELHKMNEKEYSFAKAGSIVSPIKRAIKDYPYSIPIQLKANDLTEIYVRVQPSAFRKYSSVPRLINEGEFAKHRHAYLKYNVIGKDLNLIYVAAISIIFLFVSVMMYSVQIPVYRYYLFYLFFQIIYGLIVYERFPETLFHLFSIYPPIGYAIIEGVQFVFIGFYILFILNLLQVKRYSKLLRKAMLILAYFCFAYALIDVAVTVFYPSYELLTKLFIYSRIVVLPIDLILTIWVIVVVKHRLIPYFVVGNIFFFLGAVIAFYASVNNLPSHPQSIFYFGNSLNATFQIGLLFEVICFSFAITYQINLLQKEKDLNYEYFIAQLQENHKIQKEMNYVLDEKIKSKTRELENVYEELKRQKEEEIRTKFFQKIKEAQLRALRSQMNPHFIFNSLNAVKNLIRKKQTKLANSYLDDFAVMVRGVLNNARKQTITVDEELEIVKLYLSLEKQRLGKSFSYIIEVEDESILSQYTIPSLLLQPSLENAIWHGLMPKEEGDKTLKISFEIEEDLKIIIEDNGIGRKLKNEKAIKGRKSYGMKLTRERLELYNTLHESSIDVEIHDLEKNGEPCGTRIVFSYTI